MDANLDRSGEIIEKFKLEYLLGEGGMGQVYVATHQLTDRKVALKILHKEFANNTEILARLKREAKASAIVGHPNVVEIIDAGTDQYGAPYIAMELLNGEELDKLLERKGPLPVPLAAYIVSEVLDTLQAAHNKGVIHRDLKPENIFLHWNRKAKYPQVKILDFGISKFLSMEGKDLSLTRTGTVMGTPYYMSVEQAMGQKDIDHRTDLYSVGVILYQLLTNHVPYEDTNYNRVLIQIVTGSFPPPSEFRSDIPAELEEVILKSMAKNRDDRFASADEFRRALEPFWSGYTPEQLFQEDMDLPPPKINDVERNVLDSQVLTTAQSMVTPTGGTTIPPGSDRAYTEESEPGASFKSNKNVIIIGAVVAAVVVLLGGFFMMSGNDSDELPPEVTAQKEQQVADMKPAAMKPAMAPVMAVVPADAMNAGTAAHPEKIKFRLIIKDLPKKAVVQMDGKVIKVPAQLEWTQKDLHSITVKAPGYVSWGTRVSPQMVKDGILELKFDADRESLAHKTRRNGRSRHKNRHNKGKRGSRKTTTVKKNSTKSGHKHSKSSGPKNVEDILNGDLE